MVHKGGKVVKNVQNLSTWFMDDFFSKIAKICYFVKPLQTVHLYRLQTQIINAKCNSTGCITYFSGLAVPGEHCEARHIAL